MWTRAKRVVLKIRISRFFRRLYRKIKCKIAGVNEVTQYDNTSGEPQISDLNPVRAKKLKSTFVVAISSLAIGISQASAVSIKHGNPMSRNSIIAFGVSVSAISSYVWFNYMRAASDGVTEEDIDFMFELANNTGFGRLEDTEDGLKAFDILHAVTTGSYSEYDDDDEDEEFFIESEDADEDKKDDDLDDEDAIREDAKLFTNKVSFTEEEEDEDEDEDPPVRTSFGTVVSTKSKGLGKPAFSKPRNKKTSLIPTSPIYSKDDEDDKETPSDWLDF